MKEVKDLGDPRSALWILGEAPGEEEDREGKPFVGPSGNLLSSVLAIYGVSRENVFISNCSLFRPPGNDFSKVNLSHLRENVLRLHSLADISKPNCILLLGNNALHSFHDLNGISNWRGSILDGGSNIKLVPAYHPAAVLREPALYPIFAADVKKAIEESRNNEFNYPIIDYNISPLDVPLHPIFSVDIETTKKGKDLLCVGFGYENHAYVIPSIPRNDNLIRTLLASDSRKIFHNGVFDVNVLKIKGYEVNNYSDDTIVQAHILQPELPRSLAYLNSIYTRLPYYKSEGRGEIPGDEKAWSEKRSKEELYVYNAKDVYATYQIWKAQDEEIKEEGLSELYLYEMEATLASVDLSQNGLLVDVERRDLLSSVTEAKIKEAQIKLNSIAGFNVNARSPKDVPILLYKLIGLPEKKNQTGKVTTDEDALVSLIGHCQSQLLHGPKKDEVKYLTGLAVCKLLLGIRGWAKLKSSYFDISISEDSRARSTYKAHATETGRWSASKFVDDTGLNLQTIPRESIEI